MYDLLDFVKTIPNRIIVQEHHNILSHIDSIDPSHILHVDFHQDIAFPIDKPITLFCGNFFYFIKNRIEKTFKWFYPNEHHCIKREMGFCVDASVLQPLNEEHFIFKDQQHKLGLPTAEELSNVTAVGVALSQDYCTITYENRKELIKLLRILYDLFGRGNVKPLLQMDNIGIDYISGIY